jgi:protein-disulfide isomerase
MTTLSLPIGPEDHVVGDPRAPVTLLEYGDYECAFCGRAHPIVQRALQLMREQTRFCFRHFPLAQAHPHAQLAAEAAEAAGAQGRFWDMHDMLFGNQDALDEPDLLAYADALGLDVDRFSEELATGVHRQRVRRDFRSGVRSGVNGTPSFFINGVRHDGSWDLPSLVQAMQAAVTERTGGSYR